jgi:superkiller protein 3
MVALAVCGCGRRPLFDRGVEALREGEDVAARAYLEKAISRQPGSSNNALAHNLVGVASWRLGETEHARQAFENSRNIDPTLAVAAYNLGVLTAATTNYMQATTLLHEAALLDPADPRPFQYLAHLAAERGDWAEAESLLKQALERDPLSARTLTALALADLNTRTEEEAVARLAAAIDADPDYGPAYLNLAVLAAARGDRDEEVAAWLDKYLALGGEGPLYQQALAWRADFGDCMPRAGQAEGASETDPMLSGTPPAPPPGSDEGSQREDPAAEKIKAASEAFNQGTVARARRRWPQAIAAYRRALELNPDLDQARLHLAMALHEAGKEADAVVELRKLVARQPGHARAHYRLGVLFSAQEQTWPEAIRHYRKFLELQPADPAADRVKAWIEQAE